MATARYYQGIQRYLLGFETFSRLLFYVCLYSRYRIRRPQFSLVSRRHRTVNLVTTLHHANCRY